MMTRADFARWMMVAVLSWTVLSALTCNPIGVILGSVYVFTAVSATFINMIERRDDGKENE